MNIVSCKIMKLPKEDERKILQVENNVVVQIQPD